MIPIKIMVNVNDLEALIASAGGVVHPEFERIKSDIEARIADARKAK